MNIWILTNDYRPSLGFGIAGYLEQAGKMFLQGGHTVTIFVRDPSLNILEEPMPGLRIIRFYDKATYYAPDLDYYLANSLQIAEVVLSQIDKDGQKPDIIEVQDCMALGYFLLQKKWQKDKRLSGIPITVMMHSPRFELLKANKRNNYTANDYLIGQLEKNCFLAADGLLCPSIFLKNQLQQYTANKNIKVIPLPFELNQPESISSEKSFDLLYAGSLEYRKGIFTFLEETKQLWQKDLDFALIGKAQVYEEKNKQADDYIKERYRKELLEGRLKIFGQVTKEILYQMIQQSKIVVIPSHYDNFPISCLEAMALGKPILASAQGGQAEIVGTDGECGLVFDWEKPNDVHNQLHKILSYDDNTLKKMGNNAGKRINALCNFKTILTQRELFYEELLRNQHSSNIYPIINPFNQAKPNTKNNKNKRLSIIITVNNPGEPLIDCIKSILASKHEDKEIIIVNAASKEEQSLKLLKLIKDEKIPSLRLINNDSESLAEARNIGSEKAEGEYISFLEENETIESSYYTKAIELLISYENIDYVYCWQRFFGKQSKLITAYNTEFPLLLHTNTVGATAVIRKNIFVEHGLFRSSFEYGFEKHELWLRLYSSGFSGICIPEELSFSKILKNTDFTKSLQNAFQQIILGEKMFKSHAEIYQEYSLELLKLCSICYEGLF